MQATSLSNSRCQRQPFVPHPHLSVSKSRPASHSHASCHGPDIRALRICCAAASTAIKGSTANGANSLPPLLPLDDQYESKHSFSNFGNWLVPGWVMLGRYPFVEPSRCRQRKQGEEHLEKILEAGITTFVSLQEELPPQDKVKLSGQNGFLPYKATAELIQAALNGPPSMEIVDGLRNPTLNQFLPPKKRVAPPTSTYNPKKLHFVHMSVADLGVPTSDSLTTLVQQLEGRIAAGEKLYIHCWGGRGRTGTVGACLLASAYNLTPEEALQRVQRSFDTRRDGGRKSPETQEQVQFVMDWVSTITR